MKPTIIVETDYEGYFERLVHSWVARKAESGKTFKHETVRITAGPYRLSAVTYESDGKEIHFYRSSAVTYESDGKEIHFDFYSALRVGFGSLSSTDVEEIIEVI